MVCKLDQSRHSFKHFSVSSASKFMPSQLTRGRIPAHRPFHPFSIHLFFYISQIKNLLQATRIRNYFSFGWWRPTNINRSKFPRLPWRRRRWPTAGPVAVCGNSSPPPNSQTAARGTCWRRCRAPSKRLPCRILQCATSTVAASSSSSLGRGSEAYSIHPDRMMIPFRGICGNKSKKMSEFFKNRNNLK